MEWKKWAEEIPETQGAYCTEMLIAIAQTDSKTMKRILKVIAAEWVNTTVRGKPVSRWEWMNKICPWEPVYWSKMPTPPEYYVEQTDGLV
jgi:hypothetical protein